MTMLIIRSESLIKQTEMLEKVISHLTPCLSVTSFDAAENLYEKSKPSLIFAQDTIDETNAFDFCTRIRLIKNDDSTPFIIFSNKENKKDRARTFQVGGDEYIADFDLEHIQAVIEHTLENVQKRQKLTEEKEHASNLVIETMKASSELGSVINFIERCQRFSSNEEIEQELAQYCSNMGLNVIISIAENGHWRYHSTSGIATQLERELMQSIHRQDRFVDFGARTQMNWPNIALLIKNMPLRNPEQYGRIKDLLPTLLSSANVRIHTLYEEQQIKAQTLLMIRSIETLQPSIEDIIENMKLDARYHRNELSEFLQKIIVKLPLMGLEDDQENFIVSSIEALIESADVQAEKNQKHQVTLGSTNRMLLKLLDKQVEIQTLIDQQLEIADKPQDGSNDLLELF